MAYSWRDSTIGLTLDCFYDVTENPNAAATARAWVERNDLEAVGVRADGVPVVFDPADRRLLWGSWGDHDMSIEAVWRRYHDSQAKYERLCRIKREVDPQQIFSANSFCVGGAKPVRGTLPAGALVSMSVTPGAPGVGVAMSACWNEAALMRALLERRAAYFQRVVSRQPERKAVAGNAALVQAQPRAAAATPPAPAQSDAPQLSLAQSTARAKAEFVAGDSEERKEP